jgi:Zn finger protein HypA/HybF involved in hydrogenase expression
MAVEVIYPYGLGPWYTEAFEVKVTCRCGFVGRYVTGHAERVTCPRCGALWMASGHIRISETKRTDVGRSLERG